MRAIASGWRLVGSLRAITGPWLTIATGTDIALNNQQGTQRVSLNPTGGNVYADGSTNPANGFVRLLDPKAFAQPTAGAFGNLQRNTVRGPYNKNVDLALTRVFPLGSRQALSSEPRRSMPSTG